MELSRDVKTRLQHHFTEVKKAVSGGKLVELGDMWLAFYSRLPARVRAEIQQPSTLPLVAALLEDHYHTLLHTLLPDVFQFVPTARSKAIRSVAKQVDDCMRAALNGYDPEFVNMAVTHASAFGFKLRRFTGLNHLAKAARGVISNPANVLQMAADYDKVDFAAIKDQALWMNNCDLTIITTIEAEFRDLQKRSSSLNDWATWMQHVCERLLGPHVAKADFPTIAGQFVVRWSFVCSLVIRDLTLRSAASFGSFHLMRLLCDEYVFFVVEDMMRHRRVRVIEHEDYEAQADDPSPPHPSHTHNTTDDYDDDDGVDDDRGYDDGDGDVDEEDDHVHGYVLEDSKEVLDGNKFMAGQKRGGKGTTPDPKRPRQTHKHN